MHWIRTFVYIYYFVTITILLNAIKYFLGYQFTWLRVLLNAKFVLIKFFRHMKECIKYLMDQIE